MDKIFHTLFFKQEKQGFDVLLETTAEGPAVYGDFHLRYSKIS
jgi:hypothetical protein